MRTRWPVRTGSTTIATTWSGSGQGSRSGARLRPATRRPPPASWACCASRLPSTGSSPNRPYNTSKTMMAEPPEAVRLNEKYTKHYTVLNVCGVIITTNYADALYLPPGDRRHFVANSEVQKSDYPENYFTDLQGYYEAGGFAAVRGYLAAYDLSTFDAKRPPPETQTFWEMVENSRPAELDEIHAAILALGSPDALTVKMLVDVCRDKPSLLSFSEWLTDRRNSRWIPALLQDAKYLPVRNPDEKEGRWLVGDSGRVVIYAKASLKGSAGLEAAQALRGGVVTPFRQRKKP